MEIINILYKINSIILSNYILKNYGSMSHLKLQKLLFYCDAYHLAYFDEELIEDRFEAWVHGPVSRIVYGELKDKSILYSDLSYIDNGIDPCEEFSKLASTQKELLIDVLNELSAWTGLELETVVHKEYPWIEARRGYALGDKCSVNISKEITKLFYKKELNVRN
ncbi:hypothetical protein EZS27_029497 [termite gut metagenome]|uniref:Antitoxin SocA-like Panacea domain-containing protein n=1 Tax=termite gut metagenome TaxID=433724 RepID=A0A5J4QIR9_9ZZZZ